MRRDSAVAGREVAADMRRTVSEKRRRDERGTSAMKCVRQPRAGCKFRKSPERQESSEQEDLAAAQDQEAEDEDQRSRGATPRDGTRDDER